MTKRERRQAYRARKHERPAMIRHERRQLRLAIRQGEQD